MAKKEWNEQERYDLAKKLFAITGADLDFDEEAAIYDAIRIISPKYAEILEKREQEMADVFDALRVMNEIDMEEDE